MKVKGRILSIDYGLKRIGIAISDPFQIISSPLVTLTFSPTLLDEIVTIIKENDVVEVVIGLPLKEDGSPSGIYNDILNFISRLKEKTDIPLITVDERYSSSIAFEKIIASGIKKKKRRDKSLIDRLSAQTILEDYLKQKI